MEAFEVHITGDESIHETAKPLGLKTIAVELLRPDYQVLREEHMTSQVMKFPNFEGCAANVIYLVGQIKAAGTKIFRVKIECPPYPHYYNQALYIESHFTATDEKYPISRNKKKTELMATSRIYQKRNFDKFREKWGNETVELALLDSFVQEDQDWFYQYKMPKKPKKIKIDTQEKIDWLKQTPYWGKG